MAKKYLDDSGMSYFWGKLKDYFQAKLVSGTNIKTINNESILGSGNIQIPSSSADYVVEEGTSGIWAYRKWDSGVAECWGYYSINNVTAGATFSPLAVRTFSGYITLPSGLFNAHPQAFASGQWGSQYSVVSVQSTTASDITLSLMSMSAGNLTAHLYAIGRWK